jgi:hypothetical protein
MAETFVSLKEASELSGKSVQTLRRAIKSKKIKARKRKTPQGYNFLVNQGSIIEFYKLKEKLFDRKQKGLKDDLGSQVDSRMTSQKAKKRSTKLFSFAGNKYVTPADLAKFNTAFKGFVRQSNKDREEMLCLIKAFQDKVMILENQVKLLESGSHKKWYQFWR